MEGIALIIPIQFGPTKRCLLYTSDAADERSSVDLGGRRIIKKKNILEIIVWSVINMKDIRVRIEQHMQYKR